MSIGENIKKRRIELKMTLEEVADKIGVSPQTVSRYETGVIRNFTPDKITNIAKALNTTGSYLLGYIENPDAKTQVWALRLPNGETVLTTEAPEIESIETAKKVASKALVDAVVPICSVKMATQSGAEFSILKQERVNVIVDFIKRNSDLLKAQIHAQEKE